MCAKRASVSVCKSVYGHKKKLKPYFIYPDAAKQKEQEKLILRLFREGYYIDAANERYLLLLHEDMREKNGEDD